MNVETHETELPPADAELDAAMCGVTLALTHLLASAVHQGKVRDFVCGYCRGEHTLEQRRQGGGVFTYVVRDRSRGSRSCHLPGRFGTPWEAATHVTVAVSLGGQLLHAKRDGALY